MHDDTLYFARDERPALVAGIGWSRATLPNGAAPNYLDFGRIKDLARGTTVYANFRVKTSFDNVAGNLLRFAIFISDEPTFLTVLTNTEQVIATSHEIASVGLVAGARVSVALPPLNSYARVLGEGRRYLALGIEYIVPTTDWSAGGIDAFLSPYPDPQPPISSPSGY